MNFNRVKKNYQTGLWTKEIVKVSVKKGIISELQYAEITGEEYKEEA